jgi:hypothetical protein
MNKIISLDFHFYPYERKNTGKKHRNLSVYVILINALLYY